MFCHILYIYHNYEEKERGAKSDIGKYNEQLPHSLHNWPRTVIRAAMECLNQFHDPASEYGTLLDTCTCTCPELLYRGPWCNQLAVSSHQAKHAVRNTLDRLLGSYKNCTIKQSDLDAITNPFSRDKFL